MTVLLLTVLIATGKGEDFDTPRDMVLGVRGFGLHDGNNSYGINIYAKTYGVEKPTMCEYPRSNHALSH